MDPVWAGSGSQNKFQFKYGSSWIRTKFLEKALMRTRFSKYSRIWIWIRFLKNFDQVLQYYYINYIDFYVKSKGESYTLYFYTKIR